MNAALALLGLVVLAIPVTLILLVIGYFKTRREIVALKAEIARLSPAQPPVAEAAPRPARKSAPVTAPPEISRIRAPDMPAKATAAPQDTAQPWASDKPTPPAAVGPTIAGRFARWLAENWFYAAAAVSLALAGLFFVQYGIETGLLTPSMRVAAALAFGAVLIGAGEAIRRRWGDAEASATAYLPSVLSGAGLVSLMGGILAARLLYDLIAPGPAFVLLAGIAGFGLVLGWLHGPLLAAISLIGGMSAPFLVGGSSETPEALLLYFALVTALGLGIDTLRRWAWISALSLALGVGAGWMLYAGTGTETTAAALSAYLCALVALAILIPARSLIPDQAGRTLSQTIAAQTPKGTPFPTWLAGAAVLATSASLPILSGAGLQTWWIVLVLASGLTTALIVASRPAPASQDLAAAPALALLALIAVPELSALPRRALAETLAQAEGLTEQRLPLTVTWVLLAAVIPGLAAFWRSLKRPGFALPWAGAAALFAPVAGLLMELTWQPALTIGDWPWALHGLALAALMTLLAERYARIDGADRLRTSLPALSALACLAFAFGIVLTTTALTLALAATVLAAAALDRRFDLPLMSLYIMAGVVGLGYRLVADPGLFWAERAPLWEVLASYGGTLAALIAALRLLPAGRVKARVFLESGAWTTAGLTAALLLYRAIEAASGQDGLESHWHVGLNAAIWLILMLAQLYRLKLGGSLRWVRIGLASLFALFATGGLLIGVTLANPLLPFDGQDILGPILLNTLIPAYLLPGLVLLLGAQRLRHLPRLVRLAMALPGGALAVYWAGLAIRHAWRGNDGMRVTQGVTQPELYTYTVVLLLVGAALFYQALARRSVMLRRAGVVVIGLTVAKVFFVDISGLDGLTRVFSFLLLGLALAGLAWLNRWVQMRSVKADGA